MLLELASPKTSLVYGLRKSYMVKSSASLENYTCLRNLFAAQKRNVTRMDAIIKLMAADT